MVSFVKRECFKGRRVCHFLTMYTGQVLCFVESDQDQNFEEIYKYKKVTQNEKKEIIKNTVLIWRVTL